MKKKFLSIILCLAFLCSMFSVLTLLSSVADTSIPTELVENGNFSNGDTTLSGQWSAVDSTLEITDAAKYLGLYCLKVSPETTGGTAKAVLSLDAKPDTTYMLHVSTSTGWTNVTYFINDKTITFTDTATGTAYTERLNNTQKNIQTSLFTSPSDGKLEITFQRVGGIFEIDRVYVTEYGTDTPLNLTFEDGTLSNHYVANTDTTTVNTIETEGSNKYLKVKNTVNSWKMGPTFYAATVPGRTYKLSFDINTSNRWTVLYITNSIWGNAGGIKQVNISDQLTDSDHGKWKTLTVSFTAISHYTTFGFKLSENLAAFCLDNITLIDDTQISTELVKNGSFSDGASAPSEQWKGIDTNLEITTQNIYLGPKCLKVSPKTSGGTAKAVLTLDCKPDTTYLLHIGTNGTAQKFTYYINDKATQFTNTADNTTHIEQTVNAAYKGGLTSLFKTGSNEKQITITFEKNGTFYLDRVYVTEYGCETPLKIDFEDGTISNHYVSNSNATTTTNTIVSENTNKYLKVNNTRTDWEMGPVFYAATVPGTVYEVSFRVNTSSRWANLYITSSIWGNSGGISTVAINNFLTDADHGKWKNITASFTATSHFTTFGFKVCDKMEAFCIDDLTVMERPEGAIYLDAITESNAYTSDADNLIKNPSFADGIAGSFANVPAQFALSTDGYCDSTALQFTGANSEATYLIKLENLTPATDYAFSFYAKTLEASDLRVAIVRNDKGKSIRKAVEDKFDTVEDYKLCGYTFNTDIDTELYLYISGKTGSVVLDDFAVFEASKKIGSLPSLPTISDWKARNSVLAEGKTNLLSNGDFVNGSDFTGGTVVDSQSSNTPNALEFKGNGEKTIAYAEVAVEKNTLYYFSAYVKGMAEVGNNDITFGVYNPQNDEFFALPYNYKHSNDENPESTVHRALTPPAWDGEWYKRGCTVNTGGLSKLYIAIVGSEGTVYFDDLLFCKYSDTVPVPSVEAVRGEVIDKAVTGCASSANLVSDYDLSAQSDAWKGIINFDRFITFKEAKTGNYVLQTTEKTSGSGVYYIRWIDVKPDTQYNFSVMACQLSEEGTVSFGVVDNSTKPVIIKGFTQISSDWDYYGITFNSGSNTRVGIYVCDTGVEAQYDNFRLFESSAAVAPDSAELAAKAVIDETEDTPVISETVTEGTDEEETPETTVKKNKKKVKIKKTVIPAVPGGLYPYEIAIIIGAWLLFALIVWLAVSFFTKTSVFSKRKKR